MAKQQAAKAAEEQIIFDEADILLCDDLDDGIQHDQEQFFQHSALKIIEGEIDMIEYALQSHHIHDIRQQSSESTVNTEHKQNELIHAYGSLFQFIIELRFHDSTQSRFIGATIPKGYVLLLHNPTKQAKHMQVTDTTLAWFESLHNLLLKNCKQYQQSFNERLQKQLTMVSLKNVSQSQAQQ